MPDIKRMWWFAAAIGIVLLIALSLFLLLRKGAGAPGTQTTGSFGSGTQTEGTSGTFARGTANPPLIITSQSGAETQAATIFKIADGPIAGAVFLQTYHPTTTKARYVSATDGHIADITLESSGSVPQPVSNTTIPGIAEVQWATGGRTAVMRYLSGTVIKTVSVSIGNSTPTTTPKVSFRFLPDNLSSIASSPDGAAVAYLVATASGAAGYTAKIDGSGEKTLFSLPVSEALLLWPAQGTIMAYTKSAAGSPGAVFSIDAKTGKVTELLYGNGLTATANRALAYVVYQQNGGGGASTLSQNQKTGAQKSLEYAPAPEKCTWSESVAALLYCAVSTDALPSDYLDLWHQGLAAAHDSLIRFDAGTGSTTRIASPNNSTGADILSLGLSPDEKYLLFITKGDRSLWGVRMR